MIICFFLLCATSLFSADKSSKYAEPSNFSNDGVIGFLLGAGFLIHEWRSQRGIYEKVSFDSVVTNEHGAQGATFVYSPEQRLQAKKRQHNTILGGLSLVTGYLYPCMTHQAATVLRIQNHVNRAALIEQAMAPTIVSNTVENLLDTYYPTLSQEAGNSVVLTSAFVIPRAIAQCGASPERALLHIFMLYMAGDFKNKYRHRMLLGPVSRSFAAATQAVPVMQAVGSAFDAKPSCLTLRTAYNSDNIVNVGQELYNAIVPTITYTGIDLGVQVSFDLIGSTSIGEQLNAQLNKKLEPIVGEEQVETVKEVGKQLLIAGVTMAAVKALKNRECILL